MLPTDGEKKTLPPPLSFFFILSLHLTILPILSLHLTDIHSFIHKKIHSNEMSLIASINNTLSMKLKLNLNVHTLDTSVQSSASSAGSVSSSDGYCSSRASDDIESMDAPSLERLMSEQNMAAPFMGYFPNKREYWPENLLCPLTEREQMSADALADAMWIVVFAPSRGEKEGDTLDKYRFRRGEDILKKGDIWQKLPVYVLSHQTYSKVWEKESLILNLLPTQEVNPEGIQSFSEVVEGTSMLVRKGPFFGAEVVADLPVGTEVKILDAECCCPKGHEVYTYISEPVMGWIDISENAESEEPIPAKAKKGRRRRSKKTKKSKTETDQPTESC